jgi:pimeloyl-ACP methyl ester carboxylesterase
VLGGLALANRALLLDDLPPTLPGAMQDWSWRGWRVRVTTLGAGPPIVLVHSVHAAASSFEMRNVFEPLSQRHTVYAVDLLGFGKSERPAAPYSAAFYAELLADLLGEVVREPAVLVGSSLSSAYVVEVARARPELVRGLVLISPTGETSPGGAERALGRLMALPLVGTAAFNVLISEASIARYLCRVYADPSLVDEPLVGQHWATAHQPNARLAPAAFLAGRLDLSFDLGGPTLRTPVLVLRGTVPSPFAVNVFADDAQLRGYCQQIRFEVIDGAGQLPHDEAPDRVVELIEGWLSDPVPPG